MVYDNVSNPFKYDINTYDVNIFLKHSLNVIVVLFRLSMD